MKYSGYCSKKMFSYGESTSPWRSFISKNSILGTTVDGDEYLVLKILTWKQNTNFVCFTSSKTWPLTVIAQVYGRTERRARETIWYHNEDQKVFDMVDLFREYSQFRSKGHPAFWQRPKKMFTVVCCDFFLSLIVVEIGQRS